MWVHSINENVGPRKTGSMLNRRWVLHRKKSLSTDVQLVLIHRDFWISNRLSFSKGYVSEYTVHFSFCIPFLIKFYLSFDWEWLEKKKWYSKFLGEDDTKIMKPWGEMGSKSHAEERSLSFQIFREYLSISLFAFEDGFEKENQKEWSINLADLFLGDEKIEQEVLRREKVQVPFAEKVVDARCIITKKHRKRKRWFKRSAIFGDLNLSKEVGGQMSFYKRLSSRENIDYLVSEMIGYAVTSVDYCRKR